MDADFDVKLTLNSVSPAQTRRFRLLQQQGRKVWSVREVPPSPRLNLGGSQKEGLPPERLLPFEQEDFSYGVGLLRFTPQTDRGGHTLRYADGFGIDTSEVGIVKHGPAVETVGTLNSVPLDARLFNNAVWFLTASKLWKWDGTTLSEEWTNSDGANNKALEVHSGRLFIAAGTKYWHTTGAGSPITVTSVAESADFLLTLGTQLWRGYDTNQVSSSINPADVSPVWASGINVGDGTGITNLFSISGLLGVSTQNTVYILDSEGSSIELNKLLRTRRGTDAFRIKSESGADVWFSDGQDIIRLIAEGFELFDIQLAGPFHSTDEMPMSFPPPGTASIDAIVQDVKAVYVVAERGDDTYIYKGKEIARNVYAWSPLVAVDADCTMAAVARMTDDTAPRVYFNDGADVVSFSVEWTKYASAWEIQTCFFTAQLESWNKLWHKLRAYLEMSGDDEAKVTAFYRVDGATGWTSFGEMTADGNNDLSLPSPAAGKRIQLRFVGSTTDPDERVDMRSFLLEGILRPDLDRIFEFSIIADNKADTDFIYALRNDNTKFITITDRFGVDRNAFVLPGFPVELELTDEVRKVPVRVYQMMAQEVS